MPKATDISPKVKKEVWEMDGGCCVACGKPVPLFNANAHVFVRRSHGGKGIEQNVATLCAECHRAYDQGRDRESEYVKSILFEYMFKHYGTIEINDIRQF